jgi:predicted TIM-barrel fold metal-dependent hydrolase
MITDAHMHVGEFPTFGVGLDPCALGEHLADNGIDCGIVFCPDNALTEKALGATPGAGGLYWANPKKPDAAAEAADYLANPRFRGLKLHPLLDGYHPDEPMVWPLAELAISHDLPILIHCGHPPFTLPWSIERLAARYPLAQIILGHMGHGNIVWIDGAIEVARRRPNIYLETSGMPMGPKIAEAVREIGADRVMYGSDSPFHHPRVEQLKVQLCGLSELELGWVMHRTAQQVFFGGESGDQS